MEMKGNSMSGKGYSWVIVKDFLREEGADAGAFVEHVKFLIDSHPELEEEAA